MLSAQARRELTVVLVGARNPQNIGAAARAMQDFGFSHLRVVNEFAPPFEAAQLEATSAVGAAEVMQSAQRFDSLLDAIADCRLVIGTTAIGGRELTRPILPLREAGTLILQALTAEQDLPENAESPRVALLFGSEKTGLTNEQLSHCTHLLTIPMFAPPGRHLSMNLGQSVAVCLYELSREGFDGARELPVKGKIEFATASDRERLAQFVLKAMQASDYARRFPANARPEVVRQLVNGLGMDHRHAETWMGLFRMLTRSEH